MGRSVELTVPLWVRRGFVAALGVAIAAPVVQPGLSAAFEAAGAASGQAAVGSAVVSAAAGALVVVAVVVRAGDGDGQSVWDAVPTEQYAGRFANSGGLARSEQEKALEELNDRDE
jgi:hypothetical protein